MKYKTTWEWVPIFGSGARFYDDELAPVVAPGEVPDDAWEERSTEVEGMRDPAEVYRTLTAWPRGATT